MVRYEVVRCYPLETFTRLVNDKIAQGAKPIGGVFYSEDYMQAMLWEDRDDQAIWEMVDS